ncbi:MAG: HEAT repeat domain-containing protein [Myxococcota bacterium]
MALAANTPPAANAPPAVDPTNDPANKKKVELAKNFAFQLLKGIKQIGMYRHNPAKFPEFLQGAAAAIAEYTEAYGPLQLRVDQQNFSLLGQALFSEDTPLPYKFFREGVRKLVFRPGLSLDELVTFTLIALSDPDRGTEELSAQLWRAALPNVEYIMVEGFKMDGASEEEVQVEVDQVVNYLHGRLRADSDDFLRFARVSTDDLDAQLDGVEQIRGAVISGVTADDALKAKLQKEIEEEESQRLFPKLISAVFQVVEGGVNDPALLEEMFAQLLDAMLFQEDFATINQLVLKLRAMAQRNPNNEGVARLLLTFVSRMGEEQRLARLGDILRTSRPKNVGDLARYLSVLNAQVVPTLLSVLETIELPENRTLVCDVLVPFSKEHPEPFVNRLQSDRPQTVRDMVYVLEKANHPERIKLFGTVLSTQNLAIKLDVMNVIAKGRTGEARRLVAECLNDPAAQARMLAARLLSNFDREKAYQDLTQVVKDPAFSKKSPEERQALYAALGATGLPEALSWFSALLSVKPSLFNKQRVLEDKLLAIAGLQGACTIQTYKLLQEISEDKSQPQEVTAAARKAMYQNKKALFGEKGGA